MVAAFEVEQEPHGANREDDLSARNENDVDDPENYSDNSLEDLEDTREEQAANEMPRDNQHKNEETKINDNTEAAGSENVNHGAASGHEAMESASPTTVPASSGDESAPPSSSTKESKRIWGGGSEGATATKNEEDEHEVEPQPASSEEASDGNHDEQTNKTSAKTAFVSKKPSHHAPPEGYTLSSRVYIDKTDKLAHFDKTPQRIPYWDCGYTGSTTSPLPLKDAYFRHALTGATSWSGTDGKHAVLVVALSPLAMDLNSGESQEFQSGDVILLEDVLLPGHKMRPLQPSQGVSVLFLTLPGQHVYTGKDHTALPSAFLSHVNRDDPCPNLHAGPDDVTAENGGLDGGSSVGSSELPSVSFTFTARKLRRLILGIFGMSMSALAADFLGKTAPLWLAVGVGGTCFVVAGTVATTMAGDALWTAVQVALERRNLGADADSDEGVSSLL